MLTPYEQWMVRSNLKTIKDGTPAIQVLDTLRANGYKKIADGVAAALAESKQQIERNSVPYSDVVQFKDVETDAEHSVMVQHEFQGVSLLLDGHGTADMEPGAGPVVLLEFRNGVPHVVVWADITTEEPTHVISLAGAHEQNRLPDEVLLS